MEGYKRVNTNNNLSTNITQLNANNSIIDDPQLISYTFNNFFVVNFGPNNTIPNCFKPPTSYFLLLTLRNRVNLNFIITLTTNAEVMTILLLLDDNKSTGISSIPTKLLKIAAPMLVPYLIHIKLVFYKMDISKFNETG